MPPPGKIASLPHAIRQEVNMRLLNGETSTRILPWLNALPDVKEVLDLRFSGADVNDENLSNWRQNQFRDWERKREKEESIKTVAEYASRLAHTAGSNMSAGAQAIATGKIMELLEASAFDDESLPDIIGALTSLRQADLRQLQLDQRTRSLDLAEAKFQRETADLFIKWYDNEEAKAVAAGKEERTVKIETLRQMMFGENPYA